MGAIECHYKEGLPDRDQLFDLQNDLLNELEEIVRLKIDEYYEEYKSRSSVFISRWPASKIMKSWYVRLIQGGYQDAHMHSLGWLEWCSLFKHNRASG